jgi:hypothetical protein
MRMQHDSLAGPPQAQLPGRLAFPPAALIRSLKRIRVDDGRASPSPLHSALDNRRQRHLLHRP